MLPIALFIIGLMYASASDSKLARDKSCVVEKHDAAKKIVHDLDD